MSLSEVLLAAGVAILLEGLWRLACGDRIWHLAGVPMMRLVEQYVPRDRAAVAAWETATAAEEAALAAYQVAWHLWVARGEPDGDLPLLNAIWEHAAAAMEQHAAAWAALGIRL